MTIRMNEEQSSKRNSSPETRSNQGPMSSNVNVTDEGCPVIESGTVCGETKTLSIIKEFREIYDNCVQSMDQCNHDSKTLKKLAPFRKLVEDLWEQNAMLVETVEELEHETTCRVAMLQERLNQSNEKVADKLSDITNLAELYQKDVFALIEVIRRFRDQGVLDSSGLRFNTLCDAEIYGQCRDTCNERLCHMKKGPCSQRLMFNGGQKSVMEVKEAPSVVPSIQPSATYEQLSESSAKSSLSLQKSVMSQTEQSQQSFKPPPSTTSYQPAPSSTSFKPPPSSTSFKPPPSSTSYQPAPSLTSFKPPPSSTSFKPPPSSTSFKPPPSSTSFKPPPSTTSYQQPPPSTASFKPVSSRMDYPAKAKSSTLTYKPSNFSRMSEDAGSTAPEYKPSQISKISKPYQESSKMSYDQTEMMELPGRVEMATSMDKISVISASTSTSATTSSGFVGKDDALKSYTKMGGQEDFPQIRPININLKLIRESACCVMNNQCCDCECEPDCGTCICDCDY